MYCAGLEHELKFCHCQTWISLDNSLSLFVPHFFSSISWHHNATWFLRLSWEPASHDCKAQRTVPGPQVRAVEYFLSSGWPLFWLLPVAPPTTVTSLFISLMSYLDNICVQSQGAKEFTMLMWEVHSTPPATSTWLKKAHMAAGKTLYTNSQLTPTQQKHAPAFSRAPFQMLSCGLESCCAYFLL